MTDVPAGRDGPVRVLVETGVTRTFAVALDWPGCSWPVGYALRRFTWHVLDRQWEIEDRSD